MINRKTRGFTLLELLITIAIVGILAAIAIPSYVGYTRKAYYSEVTRAANPYKIGVGSCYAQLGTLTGCNAGSAGVPAAITSATGAVATIATANGVITVTPVAANGIVAGDTYILTPTVVNDNLTWVASGGGVTAGYTK